MRSLRLYRSVTFYVRRLELTVKLLFVRFTCLLYLLYHLHSVIFLMIWGLTLIKEDFLALVLSNFDVTIMVPFLHKLCSDPLFFFFCISVCARACASYFSTTIAKNVTKAFNLGFQISEDY